MRAIGSTMKVLFGKQSWQWGFELQYLWSPTVPLISLRVLIHLSENTALLP